MLMKNVAALAVAATVSFHAGLSQASVFAAWQVANVPWGDTLNVRKYPANSSAKQAAYPNGAVLQMTGKCTDGAQPARHRQQARLETGPAGSLPLVRNLA